MYLNVYVFVAAVFAALAVAHSVDEGGHIQHVTVPPPSSTSTSDSRIQRITNRLKTGTGTPLTEGTTQRVMEGSDEDTTQETATPVPETAWTTRPMMTTPALTTYDEAGGGTMPPKQLPNSGMPQDDLVTANFFWGLGPVYPHLYQFKRVPHLVPIHSWNPYHDFYAYHKKYPNYP